MARKLVFALAAVVSLLALAPAAPAAALLEQVGTTADVADEVRFVELVNQERLRRGLGPLTVQLQLTRLARGHSAVMAGDADRGGFCGDGVTLRHRAPLNVGISERWSTLLENVGCASGSGAAADRIHAGFMQSASHRDNILSPAVQAIGVGVARDGLGTAWVTQIFLGGGDLPGLTAVQEGISAARTTFPTGTRPSFVAVSRADLFADSLGGAALAAGDGQVLFTDAPTPVEPQPVLRPDTRVEIDRLLGGSGRVYLLGGPAAVSPAVESELRRAGYSVVRLAGPTRIETATAIADEVVRLRGAPERIVLASSANWPDAVTGGAAAGRNGIPLVLVSRDAVPAATRAFLDRHPGAQRTVLGGPAAVSEAVRAAVGASRLSGPTRNTTALAIADDLFGGVSGGQVVVVDGWEADAWGRTLAWSAYAIRNGAPQVFVNDTVPGPVATWLTGLDGVSAVFAGGVAGTAQDEVNRLLAS